MPRHFFPVVLLVAILLFAFGRGQARLFSSEEVAKQVELLKKGEGRFLIINADDFGIGVETNQGIREVLEKGIATSSTIIMPAPHLEGVAQFVQDHPEADLGVHLTLNSEWKENRWGPVLPVDQVPSLVEEKTGFLLATTSETLRKAKAVDVDKEIRAQLKKAEQMHFPLTHLDCHMGWCHIKEKLFKVLFSLVIAKRLPMRVALTFHRQKLRKKGIWTTDTLTGLTKASYKKQKEMFLRLLHTLKPGITELFLHPAKVSKERRESSKGWSERYNSYRLLLDPEIKQALQDEQIHLIGYRPLQILSQTEP